MTATIPPEAESGRVRAPRPRDAEVSVRGLVSKLRTGVAESGEIARFSAKTIRSFPDLRHYVTEVFHQAGILILSSGLVIWFMQFMVGTMCGTEASYTLKQVGAPLYSGIFADYCGLREMSPYVWAYIFAAKVGCGLVAEIGSMRIADEVDAMEVMGVKSRSYLVGTRILSAWIAMPFLFVVGLGMMYISLYLIIVVELGNVSPGGYLYIFWLYQNPVDVIEATLKTIAMGTCVVFVGCYYGFTASGGPVGVGKNTAKSMMLNMVLVHIISTFGTELFWGLHPNAPIAN